LHLSFSAMLIRVGRKRGSGDIYIYIYKSYKRIIIHVWDIFFYICYIHDICYIYMLSYVLDIMYNSYYLMQYTIIYINPPQWPRIRETNQPFHRTLCCGPSPKGQDEYNFSVKSNVYIYLCHLPHKYHIYIYISHLRAMGETVLELFTGALYSWWVGRDLREWVFRKKFGDSKRKSVGKGLRHWIEA